jgi:hypothetical protein
MTDDPDTYPRAYPLTHEQLRRAYQQPALDPFFERLAKTRLEMLRKAQKHETSVEEFDDASC